MHTYMHYLAATSTIKLILQYLKTRHCKYYTLFLWYSITVLDRNIRTSTEPKRSQ